MATEEGWHTADDGVKLYKKTWKAVEPAKARVAFIHGFSDHCNNYTKLFPDLAAHGIEVCSFDQRGWGRSVAKKSQRGLTGPTTQVLSDITSFMKTLVPSSLPLFLMGHSMGGGEILCYAAQGPEEIRKHIRGYLAESPLIALDPASRPFKITVYLGRLAGRAFPHMPRMAPLEPSYITRDLESQKAIVEDELCHDTGTLEGLAGMLDRAADLESGKITIGDDAGEGGVTRLWISHGTMDKICEFDAAKNFTERCDVKDKKFKAYEGWYHRLHDEPGADHDTFVKDVVDWISARCVVETPGKSKL